MSIVTPTIISDWDDCFEDTTNENIYSGDLLVAGYCGINEMGSCDIGLRFQLNIPKDATIDSAKITFRYNSSDFSNTNCSLIIKAVDSDDCVQWSAINPPVNNSKILTTVSWSANGYFYKTDTYDTPDITTLIQAIVNRAGWVANNYIGLVVENNGSPSGQFIVANDYPTQSPYAVLTVYYTESGGVTTGPFPTFLST